MQESVPLGADAAHVVARDGIAFRFPYSAPSRVHVDRAPVAAPVTEGWRHLDLSGAFLFGGPRVKAHVRARDKRSPAGRGADEEFSAGDALSFHGASDGVQDLRYEVMWIFILCQGVYEAAEQKIVREITEE
jgi:hypothetical protein